MFCCFFLSCALIGTAAGCSCARQPEAGLQKPKEEIIFAVQRDFTGAYENIVREFSENSVGTEVQLKKIGSDSSDFYRIISSVFLGGEIDIDMCLIEDVWIQDFLENDYLAPLDEWISIDPGQYPHAVAERIQKENHLYVLPLEQDVGLIYSRKESAGFKIEDAVGRRVAVQGDDDGETTVNIMELIAFGGSVEEGLRLYKRLWQSGQKQFSFSDFKDGEADLALSYSGKGRELVSASSNVQGRFDVETITDSQDQSCAVARVYGAVVNKRSEKTQGIEEFLEYLSREDVQIAILKEHGTLPVKESLYDNDVVLDSGVGIRMIKPLKETLIYREENPHYMLCMENAIKAVERYLADDAALQDACAAFEEIYSGAGV
ncbi:extracellular solute-binding protein [Ructibacterium gallinarum]|nr:extracellular solute-binding protein [Ructibacterium gallinarum]